MSLHGIRVVSLISIFLIAVLLFGTKRLWLILKDLAFAIRNAINL